MNVLSVHFTVTGLTLYGVKAPTHSKQSETPSIPQVYRPRPSNNQTSTCPSCSHRLISVFYVSVTAGRWSISRWQAGRNMMMMMKRRINTCSKMMENVWKWCFSLPFLSGSNIFPLENQFHGNGLLNCPTRLMTWVGNILCWATRDFFFIS